MASLCVVSCLYIISTRQTDSQKSMKVAGSCENVNKGGEVMAKGHQNQSSPRNAITVSCLEIGQRAHLV
jgi:hypothetical protein